MWAAGRLDVRTVALLLHPDGQRVLLLRRAPGRRLFPGLVTGVGGAVELAAGEGEDLDAALWREVREETGLLPSDVSGCRLALVTVQARPAGPVLLLWYCGRLRAVPARLQSPEGELFFAARTALPLAEMIPTARAAIPRVLQAERDAGPPVAAAFRGDGSLSPAG